MSLRNDLNDVNKMFKFLKFNIPGKNDKIGSPAATRGWKSKGINYENKFIECLQSISWLTFKILSETEKLQKNHENCTSEPAHTTFGRVTRPINSAIIVPNKATVKKLEVKIFQVEQDALLKTIMVQGVSADSLIENNLNDMKYNTSE